MNTSWQKLLSSTRAHVDESVGKINLLRSPYLVDVDRVIYSPNFRKLQDKTQVHPLASNDYVRTRLTHSLEVSGVGRSLGFNIGEYLVKNYQLENISEHEIGYILQATCLAHDIGNPPFGHLGESIIQHFFIDNKEQLQDKISETQYNNLIHFDGNSQGFRIITKLAGWKNEGGLRLTYATLGAFLKYPTAYSNHDNLEKIKQKYDNKSLIGTTKIGVMQSEFPQFHALASNLGLIALDEESDHKIYYRHPLAFLTEAADDICYGVADIEDAYFVGLISLKDVEKLLAPIARSPMKYEGDSRQRCNELKKTTFYKSLNESKKVEWLRGKAINNLIIAVQEKFITFEKDILNGTFNQELLHTTIFGEEFQECKNFARKYIYTSKDKISNEIKGIEAINHVLKELLHTVLNPKHPKSERIINLLSDKNLISTGDASERINSIVDVVSDFTDNNIVKFYNILKGN